MDSTTRGSIVLAGAPELAAPVLAAARQLGCPLESEISASTLVAIVAAGGTPASARGAQGAVDEVAQRVAAALQRGAATVIGLAADDDEASRVAFFDAGAADVIGPAIGTQELVRRIERLIVLRSWSRSLQALVADAVQDAERQRQLFQAVADALPLSLHAIDAEGRIVVWNRGREAGPFGRPRGEVLGRQLWDLIGQRPELQAEYRAVFAAGQPTLSEVESRAGGTPRLFQVEKLPMRLGTGTEVSHVLTVSRDITAARELERSMAQTEKIAAVGRLAAGIAHEIKNPLATIAGCAEAIRSRCEPQPTPAELREVGEDAAVIEGEAYRCKEILEGLLDFSRTHSTARTACDLAALARRAVRLLRHNPKVDHLNFELDLAVDLPEPFGNEDQLVQVLLALLLNAADAAPNGTVTIRARRGAEGEAVLSVQDDGPGVPDSIRSRIFEPFFTTKPPGQGTGLGLAVAYGLVQAHGGRLELTSEPGCGACFQIVLPAEVEVTA